MNKLNVFLGREIFAIICYICLLFSTTNLIPVSVGYIVLVLAVPFLFFTHRNYNPLQIAVFAMYVYFVISTALYDPKALISPGFYRRDGNFFITFLPLLLLPDSEVDFDIDKIVKYFLCIVTILNIICLICHYLQWYPVGIMKTDPAHTYHFLFEGHNSAGGFLGVVLALSIGMMLYRIGRQKYFYIACTLITILGIWATNSRGSILAVLLASIFIVLSKVVVKGEKVIIHLDEIFFLIALIGIIAVELYIYHMWGEGAYGTEVEAAIHEKFIGKLGIAQDRTWTIYDRLLRLWPHAIKLFCLSPIFGCGFGSFNDELVPDIFINHVFAWNNPGTFLYNDSHAHQSFLHILGETGIVGLGLTLLMLAVMRREIGKIKNKGLSIGLYIALVVNVVTSFTEHRLFTPSQMIPFILILGMCLSKRDNLTDGEMI